MKSPRPACRLVALLGIGVGVLATPALAQDCPAFVGSVEIETGVVYPRGAVAVSDGYAYVAANSAGLRVIDVRMPSTPIEVGSLDTPGDAMNLAVSGSHVFVADGSSFSTRVIDVSIPSAPVEVGVIDTGYLEPEGVAVAGDYAYVVAWEGSIPGLGLHVIDVSSPSAPFQVGVLNWVGAARGIVVSGGYVYVAGVWWNGGGFGLNVIDVSTGFSPFERGFCEVAGAWEVSASNGYAYVVPSDWGAWPDEYNLTVIDVDNPELPTQVGFHEFGPLWRPTHVAISQDYAYVPVWEYSQAVSSLRVIDVSTPSAPVEIGFADTDGYPSGIAASGGYVYAVFADAIGIHMDIFRECGTFSDGFESGDTSAWSATVP